VPFSNVLYFPDFQGSIVVLRYSARCGGAFCSDVFYFVGP
jgi:hypothetical protein